MIEYEPTRIREIFIVVRLSEESGGYRPNRHDRRTKKFFSKKEAIECCRSFKRRGVPAKMYRAEVSEWEEVQ